MVAPRPMPREFRPGRLLAEGTAHCPRAGFEELLNHSNHRLAVFETIFGLVARCFRINA